MKGELLAYIAGFLDGEGAVGLYRCNTRKRFSYRLEVQLMQVDKRPLDLVKKHYGGSLSVRRHDNPKWQDCWHWMSADKTAERLLRDIYPYLIVKKERAEIALRFRDLPCLNNIDHINQITERSRERARVYNDSIIERRKQIYAEYKALVSQ